MPQRVRVCVVFARGNGQALSAHPCGWMPSKRGLFSRHCGWSTASTEEAIAQDPLSPPQLTVLNLTLPQRHETLDGTVELSTRRAEMVGRVRSTILSPERG